MILVPEVLRFIGLPSGVAANVRQILFGGTLVLVLLLRERGAKSMGA